MSAYTHIVKRQSGYVAGWFRSEQEAASFAVECNERVPSDPAGVVYLDPAGWDEFLAAIDSESE
jgi:hypothetical protein